MQDVAKAVKRGKLSFLVASEAIAESAVFQSLQAPYKCTK